MTHNQSKLEIGFHSNFGWSDIDLRHDLYEVDYLPEAEFVWLTIPPEVCKEMVKHLFLLDHERRQAEEEAGDLVGHEELITKTKKASKGIKPTSSKTYKKPKTELHITGDAEGVHFTGQSDQKNLFDGACW